MLNEDGVEVLARGNDGDDDQQEMEELAQSQNSRRLKRTPSFGNLLKTPSRLNLRRSASKLKLFGDTPNSTASKSSISKKPSKISFEVSPPPPLPGAVPADGENTVKGRPSVALDTLTPTSTKSSKSAKSIFRTALRDKTRLAVNRANAKEREQSKLATSVSRSHSDGKVAAQIQKYEDLTITSSGGIGNNLTSDIPSFTSTKTPKSARWLDRLHIGRSSTKKKAARLEIPSFESPTLSVKVEKELERRNVLSEYRGEATRCALVTYAKRRHHAMHSAITATSPMPELVTTPVEEIASTPLEVLFQPERLSVAVSHLSVCTQPSPRRKSYFPQQALVASSPLSGDLHLGASPARSKQLNGLNASKLSVRGDETGNYSIVSIGDNWRHSYCEKGSKRPRSDPSESTFSSGQNASLGPCVEVDDLLLTSTTPDISSVPLKNVTGATLDLQNL